MLKLRSISGVHAFLPVVVGLSLASSSCWFRKPVRVFAAAPPQTKPTVPTETLILPEPPNIGGDPTASLPTVTAGIPEAPKFPEPARPQIRPSRVPAPRPATPPAPTPEPPLVPKLAQIFTPEELRANRRQLDDYLENVKKILVILGSKNLNSEQTEIVSRIRTFEQQAERAREQDLVTAVSLAKRADLLARDLLDRLP